MHTQNDAAFTYINAAQTAIATCQAFACEMDIDASDVQLAHTKLSLPSDVRYADFFSKKQFGKLQAALKKYWQIDLKAEETIHPFLLQATISQQGISADNALPLDVALWEFAKEKKINLYGLETSDEQIQSLLDIPLQTHFKMLSDSVKNSSKHRKRLQYLIEKYQKADIKGLYKAAKKDLKSMRKELLYKRNKRLCNNTLSLLEQHKTVFIAVGAAHLAGENGMLRLLKKAGYKVVPVEV